MKRIYRTAGGKVFLGLICLICVIAVGVSAFGELLILKSNYQVYSRDEESIFKEAVKHEMYLDAHFHTSNLENVEDDEPDIREAESNLVYQIFDSTGKLQGMSANAVGMKEDAWMHTFTFRVKVKDGKILQVSNDYYPEMVEYVPEEVDYAESMLEHEIDEADEETEPEEIVAEEDESEALAEDEGENAASEKKTKNDKASADKKKSKTENAEAAETLKENKTENAEAAETLKENKTENAEKTEEVVKPTSYTATYTVKTGLREGFPIRDWYYRKNQEVHWVWKFRYGIPVVGLGAFFLGMAVYVLMLLGAGRRYDSDEFVPLIAEGLPWDVLFCVWVIGFISLFAILAEGFYDHWAFLLLGAAGIAFLAVPAFLALSVSFAARLKQRKLWNTCLLYKMWRWVKMIVRICWTMVKALFGVVLEGFKNLPMIWRTVGVMAVLTLVEFIVIAMNIHDPDMIMMFFILEKMLLIPLVILIALNLRRLEAGAKALAEGNLAHHTNCDNLLPGVKRSAENLNKIGVGMSRAVEERLKSERLKTELITNVSHDIKTPLTSVINYADLIQRELAVDSAQGDLARQARVKEYAEVLVRQSERLKRLLEDLVEASKAATGNLDVDLLACNAGVFLGQIAGEYEEKLEKANLSLVQKLPEKELIIRADGRRMWRLFSNLMNNICKYSLPGSRVYLTLEEVDGNAIFSFKNTSRDELNLSEEELMERFTRGDSSRHTEGSGLGLSIAKSMADIQGGSLRITTDGDLFKAEAVFPIVMNL